MVQRAEKGFCLPGQMELLYSGEQIAARLVNGRVVCISAMELRGGYFKPQLKADISARSVAPYNNSFESLEI